MYVCMYVFVCIMYARTKVKNIFLTDRLKMEQTFAYYARAGSSKKQDNYNRLKYYKQQIYERHCNTLLNSVRDYYIQHLWCRVS